MNGNDLDRHLTGNWGEDSVPDDREPFELAGIAVEAVLSERVADYRANRWTTTGLASQVTTAAIEAIRIDAAERIRSVVGERYLNHVAIEAIIDAVLGPIEEGDKTPARQYADLAKERGETAYRNENKL